MKKVITILILLTVFLSKAQEIYNSYNINGSDEANGGTYTYEAKISCKSYLAGMGDIRYQLSITNYKITSFSYNGINAENIDGISFPITKPNIQADVYFNLSYKEGSRYLDTNESKMLAVGQGYGDYADLSSSDVKKMVDYFGLKNNQDFQKLSIILSNIHIKKSYFEELSEAKNLIKQKIQTDNKIEQLKSQINSLGNSKEDLLKKKSLYQKLNSLDKKNSYNSDITNTENDLKQLARNELDRDKETNNQSNTSVNYENNNNSKTYQETETERRDRLDRENAQRIIQETQENIDRINTESEKLANDVMEVGEVIAKGFSEGLFNTITLSLGLRNGSSDIDDNDFTYSNVLTRTSYEIGFGIGKGGFTMGLGFAEEKKDEGTTFILGMYYDIIRIKGFDLGLNGEYGFGDNTYTGDSFTIEETGNFYSLGIHTKILIFYLSYNYGFVNFEESRSDKLENEKFKDNYGKFTLGLRFSF